MAEQVEESIAIATAPDVVWRYLIDLRTWKLWWHGLVEATAENHRPLREGSRFLLHLQPNWLAIRLRPTVDVAREGKTLICTGKGLLVARRLSFFLEAKADGMRLTVRDEVRGPGTLVVRLLRQQPAVAEMMRRSLRGLKRLAETAG